MIIMYILAAKNKNLIDCRINGPNENFKPNKVKAAKFVISEKSGVPS